MVKFIEKYRLPTSVIIGLILTLLVSVLWWGNQNKVDKNQAEKITETAQLITQQVQEKVQDNLNTLQNLKTRLEITNYGFKMFFINM